MYRLPLKSVLGVEMEKKNILITGLPGVGRTTLVRKLAEELKPFHPVGFYTEEISEELAVGGELLDPIANPPRQNNKVIDGQATKLLTKVGFLVI